MSTTAASPPSSMTIWHPDLLNPICDLLDTASIKALRLVDSSISETATPYLFHTLVLGLRKSRYARLQWVADRPKFAKGVRAIVWETAHYHDDKGYNVGFLRKYYPGPLALQWSDDAEVRGRQEQHVLERYQAMARDEKELLASDHVDTLRLAFAKLSGLTSLEVLAWYQPLGPEGRLYKQ